MCTRALNIVPTCVYIRLTKSHPHVRFCIYPSHLASSVYGDNLEDVYFAAYTCVGVWVCGCVFVCNSSAATYTSPHHLVFI